MNAQLADLHDRIVREGRAARMDARQWLAERDACRDVDCLDRVLDAGIHAARRALVDIESREPTPTIANARGVAMRVMQEQPTPAPSAPAVEENAPPAHEPSGLAGSITVLTLLFAGAAFAYVIAAAWRFSIRQKQSHEDGGYEYEWSDVDATADAGQDGLRLLRTKVA